MSDANQMIFRSIECIRADGRLNTAALDEVVRIALADGVVDDSERQALKNIIFALNSKDLTPRLWARVEELVKRFQLDS